MVYTELSSLLLTASPGALRFSQCKAPGTAPGGSRGTPGPGTGGAAQMGLGGASRAGSHCHYHSAIKPSSVKRLGSSKLALSYGKMSLEALQPSQLQGVTDNPAARQILWDHPSSSPLQKDISDPILSLPRLSVPSISQKKFLRSQKILPLCSLNIIIFSFLIKSHSPSALRTCFG